MGRRERGEMWWTTREGEMWWTTREGGDVVDDARGVRCGGRRERGEMWCNVPLTMDAGNGTTREGGDVV